MSEPDARWAARFASALAGSVPVATIGARAAELLDAVAGPAAAGNVPGVADDAAPATAVTGPTPEVAGAIVPGPRFATLADCERASAAERAADAALLTLDALGDTRDGLASTVALDRALGSACRLYPARLLLFVRTAEAPAPEALFAFGFRRLIAGADGVLHEYRLRDYKTPPDWLNARFWANPERFALDDGDDVDPDDDEDDEDDEYEDDEDDDEDRDGGEDGDGRA